MNTIERFEKLTPNKQSLLTVWLDQHKNGSNGNDAADAGTAVFPIDANFSAANRFACFVENLAS